MRDLLSEAIFTVTIVRTLTTIYLFARCREGERSRIILAIISLFTIFHYASRYLTAIHGQLPMQVVSTPMLLIALFMITSYIMYPIEVVSPGWINFKRIILLYSPVGEYITPNVPLVSLTNVPDISLLNVPLFTGCN